MFFAIMLATSAAAFDFEAADATVKKTYATCENVEQEVSDAEAIHACFEMYRLISTMNRNGYCLDLNSAGDWWEFNWFRCE